MAIEFSHSFEKRGRQSLFSGPVQSNWLIVCVGIGLAKSGIGESPKMQNAKLSINLWPLLLLYTSLISTFVL